MITMRSFGDDDTAPLTTGAGALLQECISFAQAKLILPLRSSTALEIIGLQRIVVEP